MSFYAGLPKAIALTTLVSLAFLVACDSDELPPDAGVDASAGIDATVGPSLDGGADASGLAPTALDLVGGTVEEQAAPGTLVGTFVTTDADPNDTHTYTLIDNPGGAFVLNGARLEVADAAAINFETKTQLMVGVRSTDMAGLSIEDTFVINVLDLREVTNLLDSGAGSLRQALVDAATGETIIFDLGLNGSIPLASTLALTRAVTIRGQRAPNQITIDGGGTVAPIQVSGTGTVTLQRLRMIGAGAASPAILNSGILVVERCTFENNTANGAIRNASVGSGSPGKLTARDSYFRANASTTGGGAVATSSSQASLIERCTFESNTSANGGAIQGDDLRIVNSTFTGNTANGSVGGAVSLGSGTNEILFSTFASNQCVSASPTAGGGVYVDPGASLAIRGSILTQNSAGNGADLYRGAGVTLTGDHNVISAVVEGATAGMNNGENGNVVGAAISLGALADNGGPTQTRLPAVGAASINLVPTASCTDFTGGAIATDQRGLPRPAGLACDAGSVEIQ